MKVNPASKCCGCLSLLAGVELLCLLHLLGCIAVISVASSVVPFAIAGVEVSPFAQVVNAAWALAGIPIIIGAGVGILYRIETHLRVYYYYLVASFFISTFWWLSFLFTGSICQTIVARDVQRMGTAFVCGFTDTFVFFWLMLVEVVMLYCIYIIWSAAEETGQHGYPDLSKYSGALKGNMMHMNPQMQGMIGGPGPMGGPHMPMGHGMGHPSMGYGAAPPFVGPPQHMSAPPTMGGMGMGMGGMGHPGFGGSMGPGSMPHHPASAPPMTGGGYAEAMRHGSMATRDFRGAGSHGPQSFVPHPGH